MRDPNESALVAHARDELARAGLMERNQDIEGMIAQDVMEIVKLFAEQGHSGSSAGVTIMLAKTLLNWGILTPLTGEDDEWNDIGTEHGDPAGVLFQNRRLSSVFKRISATGEAVYDIDGGPIYEDPDGIRFTRGGESAPVTFPYTSPSSRTIVYVDDEGDPLPEDQQVPAAA